MKSNLFLAAFAALAFAACNKSDSGDATTLTASATNVAAGQTVTVTAKTTANTVSWSVTPAANTASKFNVTETATGNVNEITFAAPGDYLVGVRARNLEFGRHTCDSAWQHGGIDSAFHHHGGHHGGCRNGNDSASIKIHVY